MTKKILFSVILLSSITIFHYNLLASTSDEDKIYKSFYSGNDSAFAEEIIRYIKNNPSTPETYLFMKDLFGCIDFIGYARFSDAIDSVLSVKEESPLQKEIELRAREYKELADLRYRKKDKCEFSSVIKAITNWNYSSIYSKFGLGDIDYRFDPEISAYTENKIRGLKADKAGFVKPSEFISGDNGIIYLNCTIDLKNGVVIRIESSDDYVFYINQEPIMKNLRGLNKQNLRFVKISRNARYNLMMKVPLNGAGFRVSVNEEPGDVKKNSEVFSPVYNALINRPDNYDKSLKLGWWFGGLESHEEKRNLSQAYKKSNTAFAQYLLAVSKIEIGKREERVILEDDGWDDISKIVSSDNNFIPASALYLEFKKSYSDKKSTMKYAESLKKNAFNSYLFRNAFLSFLSEEYSERFDSEYDEASKLFSESAEIKLIAAKMYQNIFPEKSLDICRSIISVQMNREASILAADILKRKGDSSGLQLLDEWMDDDEIVRKKAEYLISLNRKAEAKQILMELSLKKSDPRTFEVLGKIDALDDKNPDLFWEKASSLSTVIGFPENYLNYKNEKTTLFLNKYRNKLKVEEIINNFKNGATFNDAVLFRGYYHSLRSVKSAIFLCEEIINIRDQNDIRIRGDYRIPLTGNVNLIEVKTIQRNGKESESYSTHTIDGEYYISLNNLEPDCIVHIVYEAAQKTAEFDNVALTDSGTVYFNGYNENVLFAESIIASDNIHLTINQSSNLIKTNEDINGTHVIVLRAANIMAIPEETDSADTRSLFTWYSFSSTGGIDYIVSWFKGILRQSGQLPTDFNAGYESDDIYKNILNHIMTEKKDLFNINDVEDVISRKRGSSSEKTILAYRMLQERGIESFIGLVSDRSLEKNAVISIEDFSGILLYVPSANKGAGLWYDFYDKHMPSGCVSSSYEGKSALLIGENSAGFKRVYSVIPSFMQVKSDISEDTQNINVQIKYSGESSAIASAFDGTSDQDETIISLFSRYIGGYNLTKYNTTSENGFFTVSASGKLGQFFLYGENHISFTPFPESVIKKHAGEQVRVTPLVVNKTIAKEEVFTIFFTKKYSKAERIFEQTVSFGKAQIRYSFEKKRGSNYAQIIRKTYIPAMKINPEKYGEFLQFISECIKHDDMKITLSAE